MVVQLLLLRLVFLFCQVFSEENQEMKDDLEDYCLLLLVIGAAAFLGAFLQVREVHNRLKYNVTGLHRASFHYSRCHLCFLAPGGTCIKAF